MGIFDQQSEYLLKDTHGVIQVNESSILMSSHSKNPHKVLWMNLTKKKESTQLPYQAQTVMNISDLGMMFKNESLILQHYDW